jgi:hypothetical protein
MSATPPFRTVAARWRHNCERTGLDLVLPKRDMAMATAMFYAGFAEALQAMSEAAARNTIEAVGLIAAMHAEVDLVGKAALHALKQEGPTQ